jgi:hypothetical protein
MIKLLLWLVFFLMGTYSVRAISTEKDFLDMLDKIKSPFDDGMEKAPEVPKPDQPAQTQNPSGTTDPKTMMVPIKFVPKPPLRPPVVLPSGINLQGVLVGEDMHQAIINDQIVPLNGYIFGARLNAVSKEGIELDYKGKKFFLKIE